MTRRSAPKGASHSLAAKQDRGQRTTTDPNNATTDITDLEAWRAHRYVMSLSDEEIRREVLRAHLRDARTFIDLALTDDCNITVGICEAAAILRNAERNVLAAVV